MWVIFASTLGGGKKVVKKMKGNSSDESDDESDADSDVSEEVKKKPAARAVPLKVLAPKPVAAPVTMTTVTSASASSTTSTAAVKVAKKPPAAKIVKEHSAAPAPAALDLKARLMLKLAASTLVSIPSTSTSSASSAPVAGVAPKIPLKMASKQSTLDLCSSDEESEASAVRGMNSLTLSSKPARKAAVKKAPISYGSDFEGEESSSSVDVQKKKAAAVRKPKAVSSASVTEVKPQGVKRPKKASEGTASAYVSLMSEW